MAYAGVGTTKNVLVGAAGVFISTLDSTEAGWPAFFAKGVPPTTGPVTARRPAKGTGFGGTVGDDGVTDGSAEWRNVGFTTEGLEVSFEPTYGDVEVDQLLDSAVIFKQSVRATANTTFAEATLLNLITVWGLRNDDLDTNGTTDTLDISAGALGDEPLERSMVFIGKAPRGSGNEQKERVYHMKRAIQTESSSHALRRNELTGLPASFRLLPDPSASTATYGKIVDRVVS